MVLSDEEISTFDVSMEHFHVVEISKTFGDSLDCFPDKFFGLELFFDFVVGDLSLDITIFCLFHDDVEGAHLLVVKSVVVFDDLL